MIILGVGFLSDASAAVLRDGVLVSAVSEERINRIKLWHGVPHKAIGSALELAGITINDVDLIACHGKCPTQPDALPFDEAEARITASNLDHDRKQAQIAALRERRVHEGNILGERTPAYLDEIRAYGRPLFLAEHHEAHAASAFYGSGWEDCYLLTADGWGEDASSTYWRGKGRGMEKLSFSNTFDSLGYFYGAVTKALGFIPHRHEGKVLGLAALCPNPTSYPDLRAMIDYDPDGPRFIGRMERGLYLPRYDIPELTKFASGFPREDIAASAQISLEEVVCAFVSDIDDTDIRLGLAGGVFANVRLNQKLRELPNVAEVYVFPNMGDGGLSVGAAWLAHVSKTGERPKPFESALLGDVPDDVQIAALLRTCGFRHQRHDNVEQRVAGLIADGNVVARCNGPMEFGPRALGNRSILYKATDPDVNRWLNEQLGRSEFSPFAPATGTEDATDCYKDIDGGLEMARYMTMTFDCTELMRNESPAAVHVDGTARPQIVSQEQYPGFHAIITEYKKLTGRRSVINTSFNMHDEPIVRSAEDALRAFSTGHLPYLALGNFIVENNDTATRPASGI
jgi:carbamoyltransferase